MKDRMVPLAANRVARCLWAKKGRDGNPTWLPLMIHLADSAGVARQLWGHWVPAAVKRVVAQGLEGEGTQGLALDEFDEEAERMLVFLAACHDLGKATPAFQAQASYGGQSQLDNDLLDMQIMSGLPMPAEGARFFKDHKRLLHALATLQLLSHAGANRSVASVLGAHHGKPANAMMVNEGGPDIHQVSYHLGAHGRLMWQSVQQEMLGYALHLAGYDRVSALPNLNIQAQVLLSALVVVSDWIASNESLFPYVGIQENWAHLLEAAPKEKRLKDAWQLLKLPPCWIPNFPFGVDNLFAARFASGSSPRFRPHPMQLAAAGIAEAVAQPGMMIIEAPMGTGKTEAALAAAEILAQHSQCSGVFFALPTQATSNAIFSRIQDWASRLSPDSQQSIRLAHGKAQFNDAYRSLFPRASSVGQDEADPLQVHPWFNGNKKALLADFVVGTIDQLLMTALKQKHVMLRHVGLAGKVVILDEVHAYDAYMNRYLMRALEWLGAYGVPVIVLSATLPVSMRQRLMGAYLASRGGVNAGDDAWRTSRAYPLITWTDCGEVCHKAVAEEHAPKEVAVGSIAMDSVPAFLADKLRHGGCVGLMLNTVKRAQKMAEDLRALFPEPGAVQLLHAQFLAPDRARKEARLLRELGKPSAEHQRPSLRIVVGTQVLEQSLDIDFDLLITDLCPMDLLLQRIGRLHRHSRTRPSSLASATCLIIDRDKPGFDDGSVAVYGEYALMRARGLLPDRLLLPQDIPQLVQDAYDDHLKPSVIPEGYELAQQAWFRHVESRERRADAYRLASPMDCRRAGLQSWLELSAGNSEKGGEAAVRDGGDSIEVLLLQHLNGVVRFLPWQEGGRVVPHDQRLEDELARAVARQQIRLPSVLCQQWNVESTIRELENRARSLALWQDSPWLKGELVLLLDENGKTTLNGYVLCYNEENGLTYYRED